MDSKTSRWLILGGSGCGKTTLYNIITNSTREAGNKADPITNIEDSRETLLIEHKIKGCTLTFIDTMGLGSVHEENFNQFLASSAYANLFAASKLDGILICCRTGRLDYLLPFEIKTLIALFGAEISKNLVLVFTCIDHLDEGQSFNDWLEKNKEKFPFDFEARIFGVSKTKPETYNSLLDYIINVTKNKKQDYLINSEKIDNLTESEKTGYVESKIGKTKHREFFWWNLISIVAVSVIITLIIRKKIGYL